MIRLTNSTRLYSSFGSSLLEQPSLLRLLSIIPINKYSTAARTVSGRPTDTENSDNNNENTPLHKINELFVRDIENIIDAKKKTQFLNKNKTQIAKVENEFLQRLYGKHSILGQTSRFVNTLTINKDVKREFLKLARNRLNATYLSSILECGWYFCLSEDANYKREYLKQLVPAIKEQLPADFNKKFSLRYKVMLSQIMFNYTMMFSKDIDFDEISKINEGTEHIALDDFTLDFYLKLAALLESNGVEVESVSNFAEIYYTGIELKDKVLIDIHRVDAKPDNKFYKAIRERNLREMGYNLIPIIVNEGEEGNKAIVTRIIQKLKQSKSQ
jgi:hypothetical protein